MTDRFTAVPITIQGTIVHDMSETDDDVIARLSEYLDETLEGWVADTWTISRLTSRSATESEIDLAGYYLEEDDNADSD